jgi:hypothetical protein
MYESAAVWIKWSSCHITGQMKRYIGLVVAFAAVIIAASVVASRYSAREKDAQRATDFANLQRLYLERVGWIRSNPDEKSYKEEVNPFLRAYFKDVDEHIRRHGGNPEFDDYLQELEKREGRKESGSGPKVDRKAYYDSVRGVFDLMRKGQYAPVYSATDKGMRLDVLSTDVKMVGRAPQVRFELVLWGAQREMKDDGKNVKRMITSASFDASWRLFDAKAKLLGKMDASGDPSMRIDWPERFIAEFPPQMVLGHYDMDLLPAEVTNLEITFNVTSRSSTGGEAKASFPWKLEAPAEWKLKPGEKWEGAEETFANE